MCQGFLLEIEAEELLQATAFGVPEFVVVKTNGIKALGDGDIWYGFSVV